jgi:hypothetical protein
MKPIPYFYDSINRNAIMVKPKQPLLDWINTIYPDNPVEEEQEGTIYLVKESDSNEETEKWLKKNYDDIFQNELNDWHTDEKDWPQKRTYKQFMEWFAVEVYSMIFDLEKADIKKV